MAIVERDGIPGKICSRCRDWKPVSEFHRFNPKGYPSDGYKSACKICTNEKMRQQYIDQIDEKRSRNRGLYTDNIEQEREKARKYRESNREHITAIKRVHRLAHPDRYNAALVRYRETHRELLNQKAKERREANLEEHRARGRAQYTKHREKRAISNRAWRLANRSKMVLQTNRRRARKYAAQGSHTDAEWQAVKEKYRFSCLSCRRQEPEIKLTRDHIVPLTKFGTDYIDNIQPLCQRCNSSKSDKIIDYRLDWYDSEE